jgi:hypothetical protein
MSFGSASNWSTGEWRSHLGALKALGVMMLAMIAMHAFNALILGHAWDRFRTCSPAPRIGEAGSRPG